MAPTPPLPRAVEYDRQERELAPAPAALTRTQANEVIGSIAEVGAVRQPTRPDLYARGGAADQARGDGPGERFCHTPPGYANSQDFVVPSDGLLLAL